MTISVQESSGPIPVGFYEGASAYLIGNFNERLSVRVNNVATVFFLRPQNTLNWLIRNWWYRKEDQLGDNNINVIKLVELLLEPVKFTEVEPKLIVARLESAYQTTHSFGLRVCFLSISRNLSFAKSKCTFRLLWKYLQRCISTSIPLIVRKLITKVVTRAELHNLAFDQDSNTEAR